MLDPLSRWPVRSVRIFRPPLNFQKVVIKPIQTSRYSHHTCHLSSSGSILHFSTTSSHKCFEDVFPARAGSTILNLDIKNLKIRNLILGHQINPKRSHVGDGIRPYRSAVRFFPLSSAPCPPAASPKNLANMCIIAIGGLRRRLQWCIRHHLDQILTHLTLF